MLDSPNCLDPAILGDILAGGADKVKEAGAVLVGGHSVQDDEPKYGLCVSGFVHPDKIFKNYGCRPGDILVLTKQIGSGVVKVEVTYEEVMHNAKTAKLPITHGSPVRIPAIIKTTIAVKPNNMPAPCVSTFATSSP